MESTSLLILTLIALLNAIILAVVFYNKQPWMITRSGLSEVICTATYDGQQKIFSSQEHRGNGESKTVEGSKSEPVPVKGSKNIRDLVVLLVEDNVINQKILMMSLNKKVKRIDVANHGQEALEMFGKKTYDLVLMDIQMPVMDGITATSKIREIETAAGTRVPIIAITANVLAGGRDLCLAAGADDFLSKPYQMEELLERIEALL